MSLIHVKILGRPIDDVLLFKIMFGFNCIIILLIAMGASAFSDWVRSSLSIYIASILFIIPMIYVFIEEEFTAKHFIMIAIGISILVIYATTANVDGATIIINIIKSLAFATIISIILEPFIKRLR
jgi:hypothetical protein